MGRAGVGGAGLVVGLGGLRATTEGGWVGLWVVGGMPAVECRRLVADRLLAYGAGGFRSRRFTTVRGQTGWFSSPSPYWRPISV